MIGRIQNTVPLLGYEEEVGANFVRIGPAILELTDGSEYVIAAGTELNTTCGNSRIGVVEGRPRCFVLLMVTADATAEVVRVMTVRRVRFPDGTVRRLATLRGTVIAIEDNMLRFEVHDVVVWAPIGPNVVFDCTAEPIVPPDYPRSPELGLRYEARFDVEGRLIDELACVADF